MEKIIYQDSNDDLLAKLAHNGEKLATLIETSNGITKSASDAFSKSELDKYRPESDRYAMVHLIGMGDSSMYGWNKNGDWFDGDVLDKRAHTFVSHGSYYEEHRNTGPQFSKGIVKAATYNKPMHRVEIVIHLDKEKDPSGYEMMKSGKEMSFSMSCRVPNDRCSCCGNEAKRVVDYCDCLKYNMGRYMPDMHKYAYAYNDNPTFYDISKVANPADRIARYISYAFSDSDGLAKAASERKVPDLIPSAIAAETEGVHLDELDIFLQKIVGKLSDSEEFVRVTGDSPEFYSDDRVNACHGSLPFSMMESFDKDELDACCAVNPSTLFREMAGRKCMMSFPSFCQYISHDHNAPRAMVCRRAALELPDVFSNMSGMMASRSPIPVHMFAAGDPISSMFDPGASMIHPFMDSLESKFSLNPEPVKRRIITITITKNASADNTESMLKEAASANVDVEHARDLATAYGWYQAQALKDMQSLHGSDCLTQNMYDMVASSNSAGVY